MGKTTNTTTNSIKAVFTAAEMAAVIRAAGPFEKWVGELGYDTRPHVGADPLPVAFVKSYAENFRGEEEVPEWDLEGAIASLEVGEIVSIPEYWGCNYEGEYQFVRTPEGFEPLGYLRGA